MPKRQKHISIDTTTSSPSSSKYTANILPCQINHNGPVNSTKRHWRPETSTTTSASNDDNNTNNTTTTTTTTAYFRGRKLIGTPVKVPTGYVGHIIEYSTTEEQSQKPLEDDDEDEEEEEKITVEKWRSTGEFEEVVVFGHEELPDPGKDRYLRGVMEWMEFSKAINGYDDEFGFGAGKRGG